MYTNKKGISNSVIAVLMVIALIVVIIGTIFIVDGTQKVNEKTQITTIKENTQGLVQLNIAGPTHKTTGATALLALNVE